MGRKVKGKRMIIVTNIPEELVTEILLRLPVKSLLRFKCVCKSWWNLICAKDFTFLHFNTYKTSDLVFAGIHLIYPAAGIDIFYLSIVNISLPPTRGSAQGDAPLQLACRSRIINHPLPQQHDFDKSWGLIPQVCGPCNGIFCLYRQDKESILLWNPQIQDIRFIPQSNLPRHAIRGQGLHLRYTVGFGFDSETNDYKILQIVQNFQIEVYSLPTNSWRILDASPVPLNNYCVSHVFTAYRKIGWLGIKKPIIYLFDVSDETLDMIPIPLESETDRRDTILGVFPFRESIAVVISALAVPSPCGYCEIWMLDDFNCAQSRSWNKLWTIQLENIYRPLGFCGNSYLIFRERGDSFDMKLYDVLNHDVVDVGASMFTALDYKESLISISNYKNKC